MCFVLFMKSTKVYLCLYAALSLVRLHVVLDLNLLTFCFLEAVRQVRMSSVKVESVVEVSALIGEGPVWEESDQELLFVDIAGQKIHRWSPATNQIQSVETGQRFS